MKIKRPGYLLAILICLSVLLAVVLERSYAYANETAKRVMRPYAKVIVPSRGGIFPFRYTSKTGLVWLFPFTPFLHGHDDEEFDVYVDFFGRLLFVSTRQPGMWDRERNDWLLIPDPKSDELIVNGSIACP